MDFCHIFSNPALHRDSGEATNCLTVLLLVFLISWWLSSQLCFRNTPEQCISWTLCTWCPSSCCCRRNYPQNLVAKNNHLIMPMNSVDLEFRQQGCLVSVPWYLGSRQLGWLSSWGIKSPEDSLTHTSGVGPGACEDGPCWLERFPGRSVWCGFLTAWRP